MNAPSYVAAIDGCSMPADLCGSLFPPGSNIEERRIMKLHLLLVALGFICASAAGEVLYDESYRPQFHYSPPQHWMNDPNGLIYAHGVYQLFYQYNPYATQWGPMHWGHATSRDLVHWENQPIALFPDQHGTIFSGSGVLDRDNTSSFGSLSDPPLVVMFTYNNEFQATREPASQQSQGLAYSLDQGRSWAKYSENPVLTSDGQHDFRDPKVTWNVARQRWIVTLAVHDHIAFYSSPDLKHWTHESDFGKDVNSHDGVWECPDLIEMTVAGEKARKAVLLVSVSQGAPNGGSGTQYFIGEFDGHLFTLDDTRGSKTTPARWVDFGTDDYAGSTWSGAKPKDDRTLFIGWMSNWMYANVVPTVRWRSALTLPRELTLRRTATGFELNSVPASELASLRSYSTPILPRRVSGSLDLTHEVKSSGLLELEVDFEARRSNTIDLVFSNAQGQRAVFRIDRAARRYEFDRSASGAVSFSPFFAATQTAPIVGRPTRFKLHVFVDRSSIEIFINDGQTVFTTIEFPDTPYDKVMIQADQPIGLEPSHVYRLKSIWSDESN
jgi:fructan beta-fructosidase